MLPYNTFIFDIETVADTGGYRLLHPELAELPDADILAIMQNERLAASGSTFMRHHLHKIVAISVAFKHGEQFALWSLGDSSSDEAELVRRFFQGLDKYSPVLVSWNGGGFDLPVLQYRALIHGIAAQRYFEIGDDDRDFRYNNYLSRFHWRHIDMMDVMSAFQPRSSASLNDIALLCGFPGKIGIDGSAVQGLYDAGEIGRIRAYCETDVMTTYLVYLRFEHLRGLLSDDAYAREIAKARDWLAAREEAHWQEYLAAWK
ncbi:MAG: 3'-5' exonuclease [Cardiobacteriaceae bacterium]|nr:3'-5' exonuclease [Cardiobacteriaceae bacterium]